MQNMGCYKGLKYHRLGNTGKCLIQGFDVYLKFKWVLSHYRRDRLKVVYRDVTTSNTDAWDTNPSAHCHCNHIEKKNCSSMSKEQEQTSNQFI